MQHRLFRTATGIQLSEAALDVGLHQLKAAFEKGRELLEQQKRADRNAARRGRHACHAACDDCPTPAHCAVEGCGQQRAQ